MKGTMIELIPLLRSFINPQIYESGNCNIFTNFEISTLFYKKYVKIVECFTNSFDVHLISILRIYTYLTGSTLQKNRIIKTKSINKYSPFSINRQIATVFHDIILFVL